MRHHQCAGGRSTATTRLAWAAALIGVALFSSQPGYGQALTQGPLSPTTVVSTSPPAGAAWFPPANATASDNAYAQVAPAGSPTQYLTATNFGFAIPAPAQILGIQVFVERKAALAVPALTDSSARIVKAGVIGGSEHALGGAWPTTDTTATYGSPSDLWGQTWTPADINSSGFGFALSVTDGINTAAVDHISITVSYSLCATTAAVGCRTALKSVLVIKDNTTNSKDKLTWKWIKGQSTTQAEFGDPTSTASIALCVYDNTGLVGETLVAPGANWSVVSTKGWKFLDKSGSQDGIQKVVLSGSTDNKAKALMKGKGINLPDIAPALTLPVTVQMVNSESGLCWQSVFNAAIKNQTGQFKAKAP